MTFPELVARVVSENSETLALVHGGRRVTYGELGARVDRVRAALAARGIGRGDRVAVLSHNSIAYVEVLLGTLAAGACTVPLPSMASSQAITEERDRQGPQARAQGALRVSNRSA